MRRRFLSRIGPANSRQIGDDEVLHVLSKFGPGAKLSIGITLAAHVLNNLGHEIKPMDRLAVSFGKKEKKTREQS